MTDSEAVHSEVLNEVNKEEELISDPEESTKRTINTDEEARFGICIDNTRMYTSINNIRKRHGSASTVHTQSLLLLETHAPPPTNPKDKKRLTLKYMTLAFSGMYAILLVTLGLIFNLSGSFFASSLYSIYSVILTAIGFGYVLFLLFDINRYKTAALKNQEIEKLHEAKISEYHNSQEEEIGNNESVIRRTENNNTLEVPSKTLMLLNHDYCFSEGRHSGSFYLKMGAAGFAVGHLVHSILLITLQINYYLDENIDNQDCVDVFQLVFDILNPLYSFVQLYFIFQYSNVIILRAQGLAQFGFMHLIGSSLCFWTSTITRETILALTLYANSKYKNSTHGDDSGYNSDAEYRSEDRLTGISDFYNKRCEGSSAIFSVFQNLSPYLYPFSVEFNILIVAVYYIIWSNIGNCSKVPDNRETNYALEEKYSVCKIRSPNEETSSMVIHVDCQGSNRGLFMGLILIVIVIGMLIIGFVFSNVGENMIEYPNEK